MQQELVLRERGRRGRVVGKDNSVGAFSQRVLEERNDLGRLGHQAMRQLFVEVYEVVNVNIAVELLEQRVFFKLVSGETGQDDCYILGTGCALYL